jgi:poly [ADP-ribose] polymerase 7/11/12/13
MPAHWENVNTEVPYQVRAGWPAVLGKEQRRTQLSDAHFVFQLVSLHNQTHEYNEVASLFGKTMDRNRIKRIQRIQNLDLWEFFCR